MNKPPSFDPPPGPNRLGDGLDEPLPDVEEVDGSRGAGNEQVPDVDETDTRPLK